MMAMPSPAFSGLSEWLAMGHHGPYVWSSWGLTFLVLAGLILWVRRERRNWTQQEVRRMQRMVSTRPDRPSKGGRSPNQDQPQPDPQQPGNSQLSNTNIQSQ